MQFLISSATSGNTNNNKGVGHAAVVASTVDEKFADLTILFSGISNRIRTRRRRRQASSGWSRRHGCEVAQKLVIGDYALFAMAYFVRA